METFGASFFRIKREEWQKGACSSILDLFILGNGQKAQESSMLASTPNRKAKAHDRGRISTFCAGDEQGPDTISRWAGHSQRRPPPVAMP